MTWNSEKRNQPIMRPSYDTNRQFLAMNDKVRPYESSASPINSESFQTQPRHYNDDWGLHLIQVKMHKNRAIEDCMCTMKTYVAYVVSCGL